MYIDTPHCKIRAVYIWRILQGGVCVQDLNLGTFVEEAEAAAAHTVAAEAVAQVQPPTIDIAFLYGADCRVLVST